MGNEPPALLGIPGQSNGNGWEGLAHLMELESSLDAASSHCAGCSPCVRLCRVFTVRPHLAEGQVWVGSSLWATPQALAWI